VVLEENSLRPNRDQTRLIAGIPAFAHKLVV